MEYIIPLPEKLHLVKNQNVPFHPFEFIRTRKTKSCSVYRAKGCTIISKVLK